MDWNRTDGFRVVALLVWGLLSLTAAAGRGAETRKFTVPDATRQGNLGFAASISGDVGFAGAPASTRAEGKGYLFDVTTGERIHTLVPSVSRSDDLFGFNAKLSGTRLLVGDPGNPFATSRVPGAAYVFDVNTGVELMRLVADDSHAGDEFGFGINLQDDLAIIGAPSYETGTGAAYLFDLQTGDQINKLVPTDPLYGSDFGADVAVSNDYALVGAPGNYDILGLVPGSVYVFDVSSGQQMRKLEPADGLGGDEFGFDVAIDGNLAVVGAPNGGADVGAAYVFDVITGQQLAKLVPEDSQAGNNFGGAVDIEGTTALIGASGLSNRGILGAAYLFDATSGMQLAKLSPTDIEQRDAFGESVSIDGNRAFIGSPADDDTDLNAGAAYLFELNLGLAGDFNQNGQIDVGDIDLLTMAVHDGNHPAEYDLNQDTLVNQADRIFWVQQIANTFFGDADFNLKFNSSDLVVVLQAGQYEDNISANSTWATGDWDGNLEFQSGDLVAALQTGAYEKGPRVGAQAVVPEPAALVLGLLGWAALLLSRRRLTSTD